MKALILAAGYATRLYPITKEYPKPLLLVKNRPIIDYIIDKLDKVNDIDEIIVVTNSKFISRFRKWAKSVDAEKKIGLVDDLTKNHSDRRGAIGDMDFVINHKRINEDLLVIGGDNLFNGDLKDFLNFAKGVRAKPVIGIYDVGDLAAARKYGVVKINRKRQVVNFQEKPKMPKSTLAAMCLYYFPKETTGFIKEYLSVKCDKPRTSKYKRGRHDATGFYIDWLRRKIPVYAFDFGGRWYDIGDHHFYNQAKEEFTQH